MLCIYLGVKVIALTGGIACGKTIVADRLAKKGFPIIDTDQIARMVLSNDPTIRQQVSTAFGTLDRQELREIIFQDPEQRTKLEQILHPPILTQLHHRLDQLQRQKPEPKAAVVVIPLLFETNGQNRYQEILAVVSQKENQMTRLMNRDHISSDLAERMISSQFPNHEKARLSHHVLTNDGDLSSLTQAVDRLIPQLLH